MPWGVACYGQGPNGLLRWTKPYRNHYSASSETKAAWNTLVMRGFAGQYMGLEGWANKNTYYVTNDGKALALAGITYSKHRSARWGYGKPENE